MGSRQDIGIDRNWYVIRTKPRQEETAAANLRQQSFDVYLPRIKELSRYRGKMVERVQHLFPRYLFVSLSLNYDNVAPIRSTPGVTAMVAFGDVPLPLPNQFVEELQQAADSDSGLHAPNSVGLKKGDKVSIIDGPFAGCVGVFQAVTGKERIAILMDILGGASKVNVSRHCIVVD